MSLKVSKAPWTGQKESAVGLLVEGELTDEKIAAKVGITRRQLARWKTDPVFVAHFERHMEAWRKHIVSKGIALKERRIESYLKDFAATEAVLQERGTELDGEAGGGATGYICKDFKGKDADTPVYQFDAALFRERLKLREQLAKELGQWTEKTEQTGEIVVTDARGKLANLLARRVTGVGTPGNPGATK